MGVKKLKNGRTSPPHAQTLKGKWRNPGGTVREMIKGITIVRPAGTPEAYAKLASFFSALGFEGGRGWEEELSRGVSFLAPLGNLEFADGIEPSPPRSWWKSPASRPCKPWPAIG
jgi:hypothetical protein